MTAPLLLAALLAAAGDVEGPPELRPARLYRAGRRAEALSALGGRSEQDMRRELGRLFQLRDVREPGAGELLRAAIMLHTDRALSGRGQAPGAETPRACGVVDDDVLARSIAGYAVAREDSRAFVQRWVVALARRSLWDLCLVDVRSWTAEGLKWFPRDAELALLNGLSAEAAVRFTAAEPGSDPRLAAPVRARAVRELREARDAYRAALASSPDLLEARLGLGRTLWREGKLAEAAAELARVAGEARAPQLVYLAQLFLARVHDDAGRPAEAATAYRAALAAWPTGQAAAFGLAELQARGGEDGGSRESVARALAPADAGPRDPYTLYHLGLDQDAPARIDALREETLR